ncbi:Threonylcarbamoyladenosine tRNA methylthiotransferase [Irineochytrium annulatum]|nr:Threonylcarbamoyladenosine tRNA methylthiotransferase [Irineochytrium annulatum]
MAGCVSQGAPAEGSEWENLSIVGVQNIDRVVEVVESTLQGNIMRLTKEKRHAANNRKAGGASLDLPKIRKNKYVEIIPINTGCLNQCTYCKTKHARGNLGSYDMEDIWDRVRVVVKEGVKEIWLTSEDTGAYGIDIGVTIIDLLWGIVKILEEDRISGTMLRIGMTNPPYIIRHIGEMVKILSHPRVYSFLHVPVQAGSNRVLHDMRRQYTINDFKDVVDALIQGVPDMTIDIICGFPTESDADFEETLQLIEEYKFSVLHISQSKAGLEL